MYFYSSYLSHFWNFAIYPWYENRYREISMKKQLVILGIVTILISVGLSGCETEAKDTDGDGFPDEEDAFPNDITEWVDTDLDDYGDNSDDFPNDKTEWKDTDDDGYGDNSDKFPINKTEWLDTDNDGYGDNSDDLPTDSNLHEKIAILNSTVPYEPRHGIGAGFVVDSDSKYVVVIWNVLDAIYSEEQQLITFGINRPPENTYHIYYYDVAGSVSNSSLKFPIDPSNWGTWYYEFDVGPTNRSITIDHEIYILK